MARLAPRIIRDPDFQYQVPVEYGAPDPFTAELLMDESGMSAPYRPRRFTPLGPIDQGPEPEPPYEPPYDPAYDVPPPPVMTDDLYERMRALPDYTPEQAHKPKGVGAALTAPWEIAKLEWELGADVARKAAGLGSMGLREVLGDRGVMERARRAAAGAPGPLEALRAAGEYGYTQEEIPLATGLGEAAANVALPFTVLGAGGKGVTGLGKTVGEYAGEAAGAVLRPVGKAVGDLAEGVGRAVGEVADERAAALQLDPRMGERGAMQLPGEPPIEPPRMGQPSREPFPNNGGEIPLPRPLPMQGQFEAVEMVDGSVFYDPTNIQPHIIFVQQMGLPPDKLKAGGYIKDGEFYSVARSDIGWYAREARNALQGKPPDGPLPEAPPTVGKERGVARTIRTSELADPRVRQELADNPITYNPITNAETRAQAEALIAADPGAARELLTGRSGPLDALDSTVGQLMIKRAQDTGDYPDAIALIERLSERATTSGQGVQALNLFSALTPEGVGRYTQRILNEAMDKRPGLKLKLTPEKLQEFGVRASGIQNLPEGREKVLSTALLVRDIHELVPPGILKQVSTLQTMAQLLNIKTAVRNLLGNAMFWAAEQPSRAVAAGVDIAVSAVTDQRSVTGPLLGTQLRGGLKAGRESLEEVMLGVNLGKLGTQYDLGSGATRTFKGGPLSAAERLLGLELRVPDAAFYGAAVNESLASQAQVIAMNEGLRGAHRSARTIDLLAEPTKDMMAIAHQDGLYRTFQDSNRLSDAFVGIKHALNLGQDWGAGDILLKYPKTPANLLMRALDYSPAGFVNSVFDIARSITPVAGKPFNQKAFVEKVGRATVGTVGLTATGYALTKAGVLSGQADKDKDVRALKATEGTGAFRLNTSALLRFVGSGFTQKQKNERGDTLISYDWAAPLSVAVAIGSATAAKQQGLGKMRPQSLWDAVSEGWIQDVFGGSADSLVAAVDTIAAQPMLRGIQQLFGGYTMGETLVEIAKDIPSSFVPTFMSQVNQALNNTTKETYNPDAVQEALGTTIAKIPILANSLPDRMNMWGEPQDRYWQDTNNPFNVFVNPAFITQYIPRPEAEMLMELQRATGETSQFPRVAPKVMTYDGVTYQLSPKEYTEYQGVLGQKVRTAFGALAVNEAFRQGSADDQVELLTGLITRLNSQAKEELRLRATITPSDSGYFASLNPLKATKGEAVTEKNIDDYARDKPLIDRYEGVAAAMDAKMPAYAEAKALHDRLSGPERQLFERTNVTWWVRERILEMEREKLRRDPKIAAALNRWAGIGRPPATPQPAPTGPSPYQDVIDRANAAAQRYAQ